MIRIVRGKCDSLIRILVQSRYDSTFGQQCMRSEPGNMPIEKLEKGNGNKLDEIEVVSRRELRSLVVL